MWVYSQRTGNLFWGKKAGQGYSGNGKGKNNPDLQDEPNVGPIPQGLYTIGSPHDTGDHGPFVLALTPDPKNEMYGRSGFLIHGDSIAAPGTASHGCIILARWLRDWIARSGDNKLRVAADDPTEVSDLDGEISV